MIIEIVTSNEINLTYNAPTLIGSGVAATKMRGFSDLTRSNTMPYGTMTLSAPGTFR